MWSAFAGHLEFRLVENKIRNNDVTVTCMFIILGVVECVCLLSVVSSSSCVSVSVRFPVVQGQTPL